MPRKKRGRKGGSLGKFTRRFMEGVLQIGLAAVVMTLVTVVSNALSGNLTITIGTSTIDLAVIPSVIGVGAGLFLMISGLRKVTGAKI